MSSTADISTLVDDGWIKHPLGLIFHRTWTPAAGGRNTRDEAPIVLFHDSLGCLELWRDFPSRLSEATGRTVIAYDRLGFGRSGLLSELPSLAFIAQEAETGFRAIVDQLGLERFVAFGHSVGGGMAIHCAAAFPAQCEALITESAQVFAEDRTLDSIRIARETFKDPGLLQRLARYHGPRAKWVVDAWTETWLAPGFAHWNLLKVLPQVKCPVLALHGEEDEYGTVRHPTLIGELCAAATVHVLPGVGHVPHRHCADDILLRIREFLANEKLRPQPKI